jgi:hypothetical protein
MQCGVQMRRDRIPDRCKSCSQVCHCGNKKDHRAAECQPCGKKRSAHAQWADPEGRAKKVEGARRRWAQSRRKYADLTLAHFNMRKEDGRRFAFYWGDDGLKHYVYRYQWIWEQAHGAIPAEMQVHHRNEDPTDDRLENLQLVKIGDHQRYHMTPERIRQMLAAQGVEMKGKRAHLCERCGCAFLRRDRADRPAKYCSARCHKYSKNPPPPIGGAV